MNGKSRIIVTLGPVSQDPERLEQIFAAGAYGVRQAFSHATPEWQDRLAGTVRKAAEAAGRETWIMADLAGEKTRLGLLGDQPVLQLPTGARVHFVSPPAPFTAEPLRIPVTSARLIADAKVGDRMLVGDGGAELEVVEKEPASITAVAKTGGRLEANRGIVLASSTYSPVAMTTRDRAHLEHIVASELYDAVVLSFVSSRKDVDEARKIVAKGGRKMEIWAKIETAAGFGAREEIMAASDGVMVARGDLALYCDWADLGGYCSTIVADCKQRGVPWIMATQILEGLERFSFPTRAELCDAWHWAREGADGFLLAYETAFGPKPVEAVQALDRIIRSAGAWSAIR